MSSGRALPWWCIALASGPGCRQLFGIDDTVVVLDASGDRDVDQVLDGDDNCPDDPNTDQANEDDDLLGDACDPCPPFDANEDTDGDEIGSGCDPDPLMAGDVLVSFEGFEVPPEASWTTLGKVSFDNGDAILDAPDGMSAVLALPAPSPGGVTIRASVTLDAITSIQASDLGAIGIADGLRTDTDLGIICQLSGLTSGLQEELRIFDSATSSILDNAAHPLDVGARVELTLRREGTEYTCRATNPVLELRTTPTLVAIEEVGLRVRNATARYHWVMVTGGQ